MKDEIKEILEKLKSNNYPFGIATIDINKLEDYINNLQEKYDKALTDLVHESHRRIELENKITNLQKENERLKENAIHNDKVVDKAKWDEMIYKSRNEKAIECIKILGIDKDTPDKDLLIRQVLKRLLNILQGEDKDVKE